MGKTFTLVDFYKQGVLSKRNTLFWSIEMTETEVATRTYRAFHPMIDDDEGEYPFPEFDCVMNQNGNCIDRESTVVVLVDDDDITPDPAHVVCTKCMKSRTDSNRYQFTVYESEIFRETDDIFTIRKHFKSHAKLQDRYGRVIVHPKLTLTYDKMMRDLEILKSTEGWIPDIIVVDYADILKFESSASQDYKIEDERWQMFAELAGVTNTLIITATQANKAGHTAGILNVEHQGSFYGKNRHVTHMIGIARKDGDKRSGIVRFNISEGRNIDYDPNAACVCLQDLKTGAGMIDSYYKYLRRK